MNSDKMDQYFREQIQSLDRVKVPGASWAPYKSWDRIQPKKKRAAIFWWSGGSVAAVILLMLGYFWLIPQPNIQNSTVATNGLSDQKSNNFESPINRANADEAKLIDAKPLENVVADESLTADFIVPSARNHEKITPAYLQPNFVSGLLAANDYNLEKPASRIIQIEDDQNTTESLAFNRVYVFKKGVEKNESIAQNKPDLAIRIDLTMKSSNDPPGGVLANFRK